jgi:hypothetical protein
MLTVNAVKGSRFYGQAADYTERLVCSMIVPFSYNIFVMDL